MDALPILIVAIPTCAVSASLGYFIGLTKGDRAGGAMLGFFLGPVGVLIALVSADIRARCPACCLRVESGARRCGHCGGDLPASMAKAEAVAESAPGLAAPLAASVPVAKPVIRSEAHLDPV